MSTGDIKCSINNVNALLSITKNYSGNLYHTIITTTCCMQQISMGLSLISIRRTMMGQVTGLLWRLNEITYEEGLKQHLGHRKSSTTLVNIIVFPSTTTTVVCTVVFYASSPHLNCISTLQCGYHRQKNKDLERWSNQVEVQKQGLSQRDVNPGHLVSTIAPCIPEQWSCVQSEKLALYMDSGMCASPCGCCRTTKWVSGVPLRVQLLRAQ